MSYKGDNKMNNETTILTDEQLEQICEHFNVESDDVFDGNYDHYELKTLEIEGIEYAIAFDYDEAESAVSENIKNSVWCFTPWFIVDHISVDLLIEDIEHIQTRYEGSNDAILALIDDFDEFVQDAIGLDGIGHFLAQYDSEEVEVNDMFLYRID